MLTLLARGSVRSFLSLCIGGILSCQTSSLSSSSTSPADLVIVDAQVWTGAARNTDNQRAEAIAVKDGVIMAVGDRAQVERLVGPHTTTLSLPGRLVLPGFIDGHVHPLGAGRQHHGCSLQEAKTVDDVLAKVRACHVAERDPAAFVSGRGFDLSLFAAANPHKRLLDAVSRDRPLYFRGADGHSGWANSAALALAGITKDTPDPPHGKIERDPDGTPSGTLREDAIDLVERHLPEPTLEQDVESLRWAVAKLSSVGITSVMDAGVDERRLEAYLALARAGGLDIDVVACIVVDPGDPRAALTEAQTLRRRFDGQHPRLRVTATKIYLDGVLEGETAALLQPYHTHSDHRGNLNATAAQLNETVALLEADGFQVHMHVIGDAAARTALDAYAHARAMHHDDDRRGTLAHLQLVDPVDYARFAQLGVIVNAQSLWAYPDTYIVDINTPQVGKERVARMYQWGSLHRAGARIVGGSDWPVSSEDPLEAIEVMVRRQDPSKTDGPTLGVQEELDLDTALRAYTREAAFLLHDEARRGQLAPGFAADLVVVDTDIRATAPIVIDEAGVWMTLKDGVVVFSRDPAVTRRGHKSIDGSFGDSHAR
jgi:predicted amidohydrolase YtcJ